MSKPVKDMIVAQYKRRFADVENAVLVNIRGIGANDNNRLRLGLMAKEINVTVVSNTLARRAFRETSLEALDPMLTGPSALVYGGNSVVEVARELIDLAKQFDKMELKGAVLDGTQFLGPEEVKRLSKFPTREEAQAELITLILSPARKLVGAVKGPGGRLMGIVKAIEEKLEQGEAIEKSA